MPHARGAGEYHAINEPRMIHENVAHDAALGRTASLARWTVLRCDLVLHSLPIPCDPLFVGFGLRLCREDQGILIATVGLTSSTSKTDCQGTACKNYN